MSGETNVPSNVTDAIAVAGGYAHTLALLRNEPWLSGGTKHNRLQISLTSSALRRVINSLWH